MKNWTLFNALNTKSQLLSKGLSKTENGGGIFFLFLGPKKLLLMTLSWILKFLFTLARNEGCVRSAMEPM